MENTKNDNVENGRASWYESKCFFSLVLISSANETGISVFAPVALQFGGLVLVSGVGRVPTALHDPRFQDQQEVPQSLRAHHRTGSVRSSSNQSWFII